MKNDPFPLDNFFAFIEENRIKLLTLQSEMVYEREIKPLYNEKNK